jgi:hypothetical protein
MFGARAAVVVAVAAAVACAPSGPRRVEIPANTTDYLIRVSWEPSPARARERTMYRLVVRDKETREMIDGGEGLVFATSADGVNIHGVMQAAEQPGTYTAQLRFITSGEWAVSLQFRRDSTVPLQRPAADWRQTVYAERQ